MKIVSSALQKEKSRPEMKKSAKNYTEIQGQMGIRSFHLLFLRLFFLTELLVVIHILSFIFQHQCSALTESFTETLCSQLESVGHK